MRRWVWWAVVAGILAAALLTMTVLLTGDESSEPPQPRSLVRKGARPITVRYGDLDGDGVEEVVVASASGTASGFGLPTPYLEVFARREGAWRRVFDATGSAPPGRAGTPVVMLQPSDPKFAVSQSVQVLHVVDFAGDETPEIVAGIATAGATAGPLELWIVSMARDYSFETEFYETTARSGRIGVMGSTLSFEFGVYKRGDPGCCPSLIERQTIGFNEATGRIQVLERARVTS